MGEKKGGGGWRDDEASTGTRLRASDRIGRRSIYAASGGIFALAFANFMILDIAARNGFEEWEARTAAGALDVVILFAIALALLRSSVAQKKRERFILTGDSGRPAANDNEMAKDEEREAA